jgi:hypothetical protein
MPKCPFEITGPKTLAKGETAKYQLKPMPDGALCTVQWLINDRPLRVSSTYADLFIRHMGFDEITVTAMSNDPGANITATVTCRGEKECGPTDIPFVVGTPLPDDSMKAGNIALLVLLPFIVVVGVALLPVWITVWIIDRVSRSDEESQVKKVSAERRKLLPSWFR